MSISTDLLPYGATEPEVANSKEVSDRLNPIELFMWRVSQDPTLRMTVGTLMILDRPPAAGALGERLESAVAREPQLRRLPNDATRLGRRPAWIEDPAFDVGNHLRMVTLPSPGSDRQLLDYVALIESIPFDPDRSPWDVTLIDGLEGQRGVLYLRAHHVLTDGIGAIWLIDLLLDDADEATDPTPSSTPKESSDEATPPRQERQAGTVTIDFNKALRPLKEGVTTSLGVAPGEAADVMVRGIQRGLDVANSVSRQVLISGGPLASLPTSRSMASRFETLSITGARESSLALGGSRNDLLVAAAAAGLGQYQERVGQPCPELRLVTPTSLHHGGDGGGNWFAPIRVTVPTATDHPGPQFGVVAERLAQGRSEAAIRVTAALASTISRLPTRLLIPAMHAQANSVDFAATTLPGLRGQRRIVDAVIESSYPLGPRLGCPMNISAFGNEDRLDVGIALDPAAITDPDSLLECLSKAFGAFESHSG